MDATSGTTGAGDGDPGPLIDLTDGGRVHVGHGAEESDTRARLVRAAAEVFSEKGYTGTRVADIARRAGFTSGALYGHFESRASLLAEAIAVENDRLLSEVSEHLSHIEGRASRTEVARAMAGFAAQPFSPSDQLLLDGLAICQRDQDARDRIAASLRLVHARLEESIRDVARDGSRAETDPGAVGFMLLAFLVGSTALRAADLQDLVPPEVASVLEDLHDVLGVDPGGTDGAERPGPVSPPAGRVPD